MLTLEALKAMEPETIFASGTTIDGPEGLNMARTGKLLRWVAIRGGIHDWAIYAHFADLPAEEVARIGDKVSTESHIKRLVPCDDAAFEMYRY